MESSPDEAARSEARPPNVWVENSFLSLLTDAIENAYLATAIPNPGSKARFIRFSIIHCALAIECAANASFQLLVFSPDLLKKIERHLGTLDKFEMVSIALFRENRFQRGFTPVQRIRDLIELRNDYVHPKVAAQPVISKDDTTKQITVYCGQYQFLKIDRSYRAWKESDPQVVLRAVDEFLTYFFSDHCQWTAERTTEALMSRLVLDGKPLPPNLQHERDYLSKAESMWGIKFPFIHRPALVRNET